MKVKRPRTEAFRAKELTNPTSSLLVCSVPGCGRAPERRQGNGRSPYVCRYHHEYRRRHGCAWKRSYTGPELRPYIRAATTYLKSRQDDASIAQVVETLRRWIETSGPTRTPGDLRGLNPKLRVDAVFAGLRRANVPPDRVLAVTLGVLAAIEEDPIKPGGDYPRVQVAKAVRRRKGAAGYHSDFGEYGSYHAYSRSAGKVLVLLGETLLQICGAAIRLHLKDVLVLKIQKYGARPIVKGPPPPFVRSKFGNERVPPPPPIEAPPTAPIEIATDQDELERYARRLNEEARRKGAKAAFDGKF